MLACIIKIVTCKQDAIFPKSVTFTQSSGAPFRTASSLQSHLPVHFHALTRLPIFCLLLECTKWNLQQSETSCVILQRKKQNRVFVCTCFAIITQAFLFAVFYGLVYKLRWLFLHPKVPIGLAEIPC